MFFTSPNSPNLSTMSSSCASSCTCVRGSRRRRGEDAPRGPRPRRGEKRVRASRRRPGGRGGAAARTRPGGRGGAAARTRPGGLGGAAVRGRPGVAAAPRRGRVPGGAAAARRGRVPGSRRRRGGKTSAATPRRESARASRRRRGERASGVGGATARESAGVAAVRGRGRFRGGRRGGREGVNANVCAPPDAGAARWTPARSSYSVEVFFRGGSRRRRGRDVDIPWTRRPYRFISRGKKVFGAAAHEHYPPLDLCRNQPVRRAA